MLLIVYDIPFMFNFVLCATLVHYSNTMSLMLTQVFKHRLLIPRSKCLNYSAFCIWTSFSWLSFTIAGLLVYLNLAIIIHRQNSTTAVRIPTLKT